MANSGTKQFFLDGNNKGLNDMNYYKYLFEQEINNPCRKFHFMHITYPFFPIYACGSASFEPIDYTKEWSINNAMKKKVWDAFFINIIPQKNSLEIIIGYHKNHINTDLSKYVNSWCDLSLEQLQVKLSDLFISRLEMWGMSPSLYNIITEEKKKQLMENIKRVRLDFQYDIREELNINLFV